MRPDIPVYIHKNAIVYVDGKKAVIEHYYWTGYSSHDIIRIQLADGRDMAFDKERVKGPKGKIPDFIREGNRICILDGVREQAAGEWEIRNFFFSQSVSQAKPVLRLELERPGKFGGTQSLSIPYDPLLMKQVVPPDELRTSLKQQFAGGTEGKIRVMRPVKLQRKDDAPKV